MRKNGLRTILEDTHGTWHPDPMDDPDFDKLAEIVQKYIDTMQDFKQAATKVFGEDVE